jgi:hypothetical protein
MRVMTTEKKIVKLKHFRFCHEHFDILVKMQSDQTLCNCLMEIEAQGHLTMRLFMPLHQLVLDDFRQLSLYNANA